VSVADTKASSERDTIPLLRLPNLHVALGQNGRFPL
jgi:hypothetical protein